MDTDKVLWTYDRVNVGDTLLCWASSSSRPLTGTARFRQSCGSFFLLESVQELIATMTH